MMVSRWSSHLGAAEGGGPVGKGQVGGDQDRGARVEAAVQVEEWLAPALGPGARRGLRPRGG